ncbi:hypothetical protein PBCVKS1B_350R [Paramecium bursaria Chlorella virus KS1B]|nr:hypothetical protein PBCVKS1B_350R [Paramecium bursaria Chlorella virus KS1B]
MDSAVISKYCNFRMTSGAIIAGVIGIILFFVGVFASKIVGDTSSYVLTDAVTVGGDIKTETVKSGNSYRTYFDVVYNVEYEVSGKKYYGTTKDRFYSFSQAKNILDSSKGSIKKIYYDPINPVKNSESKGTESFVRWVSFGSSTLLFGYAVVAWMLRDNMAMCAITTLGNITR